MKKIIAYLMIVTGVLVSQYSQAQDVSINVTNAASIAQGDSTPVLVSLCNEDPNPIDAPANKLRPQLSAPNNVIFSSVTNTDGTPLTGWTILSKTTTTVRLLNQTPLVNGECVEFYVWVIGTVISGSTNFNGTLGFQGPQTSGNNIANDNSITSIAVTAPLPVTLVSFDVQKEGQVAKLKWATTAETNSDYFEIQHSVTGKEWAKIGNVASTGESSTLKNYTFSHGNPVNGENLYRLRMVDKDQTFAYSRIQSVKFDGITKDLTIYPNPVSDKLFLRDFKEITNIQINDLSGHAVYQADANTTGEINISGLKSGMYIVKISRANGLTSTQKIVVSK
ncbi:T9SS type A sorting domain-containing protein [Dyadobacter diqingensis]|uniref:T9SS type A sorting domain-containing protein n=1 Tax=Dyadobacter diqingensis TaxID=2938121 RepID=UPI0020C4CA72|nr:T9SS type A sorting domain-containing protein [Dyadobacter diqingensis]